MRKRFFRRYPFFATGLLLALVAVLVALSLYIPTPYQLLQPGPAVDVNRLIQPRPESSGGALYLTTLRSHPASVAAWVYGRLSPEAGLVPREQARPREVTEKDYQHLLTRMMDESKLVAQVVALRAAGYEVEMTGRGVLVTGFAPGSRATEVLSQNDVIVAAAGQPVRTVDDLVGIVQPHRPGETLLLAVLRPDTQETRNLAVPLVESTQEPGRAVIGVYVQTHGLDYRLPREVRIETRDIGGSSAGLMLALAVYNSITDGDLTHGHRVAGTGALDRNGKVLPVGGVRYKVRAAEKAGAGHFLVPRENAAEARAAASRLRVAEVASFQDALDYLRALPAAR